MIAVKIVELPDWDTRHELWIMFRCGSCGWLRWRRQWKGPPWPKGYISEIGLKCPKCE